MIELAIPLMFTGAVIFVWGFRAIRNRRVNVAVFKLRSLWSTLIFGISAVLCGFLMMLSGFASAFLDAAQVEIMAKSGLVMFGAAWLGALVLEALARIGWRISPADAPWDLRERENAAYCRRGKRKPTPHADDIVAGGDLISSSRRWLQNAISRFLLSGSKLYHRVTMLPPRSWDKQNLWHDAEEHEKQKSHEKKRTAELDHAALRRDSRQANGERKEASFGDRQ